MSDKRDYASDLYIRAGRIKTESPDDLLDQRLKQMEARLERIEVMLVLLTQGKG